MSRFTIIDAKVAIQTVNNALERIGHNRRLTIQARNGYYGLDCTNDDGTLTVHTIITGTAKMCADAAWMYRGDTAYHMLADILEKDKNNSLTN